MTDPSQTRLTPAQAALFDAIKRTDERGDHWAARDLQRTLKYSAWREFARVIDRAKTACTNSGHRVEEHFVATHKVAGSGPAGEDYRLTRYAAYLVAMSGDSAKTPVAHAKTYFAAQTYRAETQLPSQRLPDITTPEGALAMAEQYVAAARALVRSEREKAELAEQNGVISAALESATPAIEYHEKYVAPDDLCTIKAWATQFGLTEPKARDLLAAKNICYRFHIGRRWSVERMKLVDEYEWRAYAGKATTSWFALQPQHNAPRHHNNQVRQTLYVRQQHAIDLGRKVGLVPVGIQTELITGDLS